jgi:ribosomal protein S18 acetylase RimI-like enzyme
MSAEYKYRGLYSLFASHHRPLFMNNDIFRQIKHQESHQRLIKSSPRGSSPRSASQAPISELDAIIVPSSRPADFLSHAIDLALATDSWLIVFCSGSSKTQDVRELLGSRFLGKAAAAEVPRGYMHSLIEFATSSNVDFKRANLYRDSDLSLKRNLGLIVSLMLGWKKIFFLDDDIRDLAPADLHRTASLLDEYSCVGFSMDYFPDNSVVSHAKRLGFDSHQEIMISGAAMGVRCRPEISFFPDIYNEDLFFILDDIACGSVLHAGTISQLPYEPFDQPERAASEEFGEVLMEGLLALLHAEISLAHATSEYWLKFLPARLKHIQYIKLTLERKFIPGHEPALIAMRAAESRLSEISSNLCAAYLTELHTDLSAWKERLRNLTPQSSVSTALSRLNLVHVLAPKERQDVARTEAYEILFGDKKTSPGLPRPSNRSPTYSNTTVDDPGTQLGAALSPPSHLLRTGGLMHPAAEQILIRKLSEDDWKLLQRVRLQALQDSPRAFASSYHKEEGFTEQQWRLIIQGDLQWFVAFVITEPVGIVAARSGPDISPDERYVESMWVAPKHRTSGIAKELMSKLAETVHTEGANTLFLWVLDGNDIAGEVYLKLGFTYTGDRQPLKTYPNRTEERMMRPIT